MDEECEMIIELAQEKGMKESPIFQDTDKCSDKDSIEDKLKAWDKNEDGFIDKNEVRLSFFVRLFGGGAVVCSLARRTFILKVRAWFKAWCQSSYCFSLTSILALH